MESILKDLLHVKETTFEYIFSLLEDEDNIKSEETIFDAISTLLLERDP